MGSEMIFSLLPLFLTQTLHAGPAFLGLLEGAADTVASLLKLLSGHWSDRLSRRKPLVLFGYGVAGAVRPLMALATAPWHVLVVRLTDRVGKGLRASPRDALIADAAGPGQAGRAFGFHKAMDHVGAVVGPLIGTALLALGLSLRNVFWLATIPGVLAILALLTVKEPPRPRPAAVASPAGAAAPRLPRTFYSYLAIMLLFSLGNSSDAFLLVRAHELGVADRYIPTMWTVLHLSKLFTAYFGGPLADRFPRTRLILAGWLVYAAVYAGLGLATTPAAAWWLFVLYGSYHGLTEPAQKALVRDLAPDLARGRAYGAFNFVVGVSALPAGLLCGWLWKLGGARLALGTGAALAAAAATALAIWSLGQRRARGSAAGGLAAKP